MVGVQFAGQFPEVLSGVKKIDNLNCAGEMLIGNIPDPFRSIAHDDFLFGAAPAALPGFQIDALAELFRRFDGANVGSGIGIADGDSLPGPKWFA